MYLLLFTQGVMVEVGTKYHELCLHKTSEVGDIIQTDLKLKKGVDAWRKKHEIVEKYAFNFNVALSMCEALATRYENPGDVHSHRDSLYSAGLEGLANGYLNAKEDLATRGYIKTSIRNSILNELRKSKRWGNEVPDSDTQTMINGSVTANKHSGGSSDGAEELTVIENASEGLWQEQGLTPEESMERKEELSLAHQRVADLIKDLNERERYVLWNHVVTADPESVREIANQFQCGKSSIHRDINRVRERLKI